jgi:hypothetical protein
MKILSSNHNVTGSHKRGRNEMYSLCLGAKPRHRKNTVAGWRVAGERYEYGSVAF